MELGEGITPYVVSTRMLRKQAYFDSPNDLARYMRTLGFKSHPKLVNIRGIRHKFWYKDVFANKALRLFKESFNNT